MTIQVVAILGDFYHDERVSKKALQQALTTLNEQGTDVSVEYITAEELVDQLKKAPDLVVLFKENRINPQDELVDLWMSEEVAHAITDYVSEGGGWLAWHSGLACYGEVEEYISMLRGQFISHPADHQVVDYVAVEGSDFLVEDATFRFMDEHYFVECDEERTNVLLRTTSVDGKSVGGWAHEFAKGRVACLAPAHLEEGLLNPAFQRLLANTINWCAGKE